MVTEVFNCDPEIETKNVSLYQAIPIKFFYKREISTTSVNCSTTSV